MFPDLNVLIVVTIIVVHSVTTTLPTGFTKMMTGGFKTVFALLMVVMLVPINVAAAFGPKICPEVSLRARPGREIAVVSCG